MYVKAPYTSKVPTRSNTVEEEGIFSQCEALGPPEAQSRCRRLGVWEIA